MVDADRCLHRVPAFRPTRLHRTIACAVKSLSILSLSAVFAALLPAVSLARPLPLDPAREAAVSSLFEAARQSPTHLRVFLRPMPKGGDLHNHLGGAIYAEDYLRWGAEAGLCVSADGLSVASPPCAEDRKLSTFSQNDEFGYDRLVHALSTRGWQRGVGRNDATGHTQFFRSFARFGPIGSQSASKMLASARAIAAGDNLSYLELDHNTTTLMDAVLAAPAGVLTERDLPARLDGEIAALQPLLAKARAELTTDEATSAAVLGCAGAHPDPGCGVSVHYLFQAMRALPPTQVFRSLILGFMMADADPRFVGVNIVMPEDAMVALRDYDLHMAMFRLLEAKYPHVRRTLHAGELTLGLVPPAELRNHIGKALDAGAERIGHGTDIAFEDDAEATMARMARDGVAVEINLTSNDVILGVHGADHPVQLYRDHGVPVVLSTDDQGVLRSDMTNEYVRAAREQGFDYRALKQAARSGLHYAFLPGNSLWTDFAALRPVDACGTDLAAPACARFLERNEKARLEADLEARFAKFESDRLAVASRKS
ncbi:adenosine deaminase family protein [Novosphingobium olei]|uniref:adenosine deaminase n=1 Tax=Novosphingobium olei TaxID=2728851 RepID=A0A7Y0BKR2_9SPHN|nr:adenosine deaminase [Novosphingobium olei]NML92174.1 adenosine deaminase [Novosphingobium olei]